MINLSNDSIEIEYFWKFNDDKLTLIKYEIETQIEEDGTVKRLDYLVPTGEKMELLKLKE